MNWRCYYLATILPLLASCQNIDPPPVVESQSQEPPASITTHPAQETIIVPEEIEQAVQPVPITDLWQRIAAGFVLQEEYQQALVQDRYQDYRDNQRYFDLIAERARPFLFTMVEEIERRKLPMELALLPMVESTFDPNAYSAEHAVGLWQFVGSTADSFGLQRDWWYDGRRDPFASTTAALDYLSVLHEQFDGDWLLALAAYNTGDGNVRRAIRRSDIAQPLYWDLALARETRFHIPKLLALAAAIADNESFGIELPELTNEQTSARVELDVQIDLATAARLIGMEAAALRRLNPGYLQWATHPDRPQAITVPLDKARILQQEVAALPEEQRVSWDNYQIAAGDTLSGIASRLDTSVDVLRTVNSIAGSRIIAGETLLIPRIDNASMLSRLALPAQAGRSVQAAPLRYRVRRGDNLWSIARRFDLRSGDIAQHNAIDLDSILRPGQLLDLSFARVGIAD